MAGHLDVQLQVRVAPGAGEEVHKDAAGRSFPHAWRQKRAARERPRPGTEGIAELLVSRQTACLLLCGCRVLQASMFRPRTPRARLLRA
jgi:hypothetical protein